MLHVSFYSNVSAIYKIKETTMLSSPLPPPIFVSGYWGNGVGRWLVLLLLLFASATSVIGDGKQGFFGCFFGLA